MSYKKIAAQDFMTVDILAEIGLEQEKLRELMKELIDREVSLTQADLSKGNYTMPFPSLINIVERNFDRFMAGGYVSSEMGKTVVWKGELNDRPRFSYKDVNRWFESCEILTAIAHSVANWAVITGNFASGDNRIRQLIR